jgi:hypothetical protein
MHNSRPYIARCILLAGITLAAFTSAYGQSDEVKIKNTSREIRPGLYECIIYLEMSEGMSKKIDDVTYTFPFGFAQRRQRAKKIRPQIAGFFSSKPFVTAEEIVVNILIDYKGVNDVYLSYKLNPSTAVLK